MKKQEDPERRIRTPFRNLHVAWARLACPLDIEIEITESAIGYAGFMADRAVKLG